MFNMPKCLKISSIINTSIIQFCAYVGPGWKYQCRYKTCMCQTDALRKQYSKFQILTTFSGKN